MKKYSKIKKQLLFVFFVIFFPSIWVAEFSLAYINYMPSYVNKDKLRNVLNKHYKIKKNKNENIRNFVNSGIEPTLYPALTYKIPEFKKLTKLTNFLPLAAQPNKKLFLCDEGYGFITYETDHLGFRNNKEDWNSYPYNAIVIGDSYVHGSCVEDEDTISGNLKKLGVKNLNLGQGDNSPLIYGSLISQFSMPLPPKNIILVFSLYNDLMGENNYKNYENNKKQNPDYIFSNRYKKHILSERGKKYFDLANKKIKKVIENKDYENTHVFSSLNYSNIYSILKLTRIRMAFKFYFELDIKKDLICYKSNCLIGSYSQHFEKKLKNAFKDINLLLNTCNKKTNCNPIVVLIQHSNHWDNNPDYKIRKKIFDKKIKKLQKEIFNFTYIDVINGKDLSNYAPAGGHLSKDGYQKIAISIKENIK